MPASFVANGNAPRAVAAKITLATAGKRFVWLIGRNLSLKGYGRHVTATLGVWFVTFHIMYGSVVK
jgi:hypothetical protein